LELLTVQIDSWKAGNDYIFTVLDFPQLQLIAISTK